MSIRATSKSDVYFAQLARVHRLLEEIDKKIQKHAQKNIPPPIPPILESISEEQLWEAGFDLLLKERNPNGEKT